MALSLAVLALALGLLAPGGASADGKNAPKPRFTSRPLEIGTGKLYDVSVADAEGDGDPDLFSTAHRYRGNLLLNNGRGRLRQELDASGLSATADIPGFDDQFSEPKVKQAGLYIWIDADGNTHIVTHDLGDIPQDPLRRVTGSIRYRGRLVDIQKAYGSRVKVLPDHTTNPVSAILGFDSSPDSEIIARAQFMDLPFDISVDPKFPRSHVFLGPRLSHPPAYPAVVHFGDRHGMGWADLNQDGNTDVYIANGGNRGAIDRLKDQSSDELYFGDGSGHFKEDIAATGIQKGVCRGRSVEPVDYNSDGALDIFIGCQSGHPLLYRQQKKPGRFGSASNLMQDANVRGHLYRWIDLGNDRAPELISVDKQRVRVYRRNPDSGGYAVAQTLRPPTLGNSLQTLSVGDADGDLDPDIFIAARGGNALLLDRHGKLGAVPPARVGLPADGTVNLSFVDYDNDGRMDAAAIPGGLFHKGTDGEFHATAGLDVGAQTQWASASWADLNGDGRRDLVALIKRHRGVAVARRLLFNETEGGHWLDVSLKGPRGNAEAIGAKVRVVTSKGAQEGWVGEAEGSRHSSGLYDVPFGLGLARHVESIHVEWPNGGDTKLTDVAADQRLVIAEQR